MSNLPWNWIIPIAIVGLAIVVSVGLHMMQQARRSSDAKAQEQPKPDTAGKPQGRSGARAKAE